MCLKELIFTTFTYELRYIYSLTISQYTLTNLIPLFKRQLIKLVKVSDGNKSVCLSTRLLLAQPLTQLIYPLNLVCMLKCLQEKN